MLLVYVASYFMVIMVGGVLPWWVLVDWWWGGSTVDMDTVVVIACVSWVFGFWEWLESK